MSSVLLDSAAYFKAVIVPAIDGFLDSLVGAFAIRARLAIAEDSMIVRGEAPPDSVCITHTFEDSSLGAISLTIEVAKGAEPSVTVLMESVSKFITVYIDTLFFRHAITLVSLHEILTSLTSATHSLEYLESRALPKLLAQRYDKTMDRASELLMKMSDQLLLAATMTRSLLDSLVESNEEPPASSKHLARVDLRDEVLRVVDLWREEANRKEVSFRIEMEHPVYVMAQKGLLLQLLNNLISNAVKYSYHTTARSRPRFIRVRLLPHDPGFRAARAKLSISNYGLGLEDEEREKLGQLGFRGAAAKREQPLGFGVGVHVARRLARVHGGELVYTWKKPKDDTTAKEGDPAYLVICDLTLPVARKAEA